MTRPFSLSDQQLETLKQVAASLPLVARDKFLQGVAQRLGERPSDIALETAINLQLAVNRLPNFLSTEDISS